MPLKWMYSLQWNLSEDFNIFLYHTMSHITQNWFYQYDNNDTKYIFIEKGVFAGILLKNTSTDIVLELGEKSKCEVFWYFDTMISPKITFIQSQPNSSFSFRAIILWYFQNLSSQIVSQINTHSTKSSLNIISIVKEKNVYIDSSISISKNSTSIQAKLDLQNIFIWETGTIHSQPNLYVDNNDIQVSHSSKTHRIDENKLFYLKSRWLTEDMALTLMIEWYFRHTFACIEMYDIWTYEGLYKDFSSLH